MSTISQIASAVQSATSSTGSSTTSTSSTSSSSSSSSSSSGSSSSSSSSLNAISGNFDMFLQLLTTQLQNQDPLNPMDTDQFTQQLVEFASVEQQIDENTNLQTLISLQQTSEDTQAMQFLGATVTVNSSTAALANASNQEATWSVNSASPATAAVTITSSTGQVAYTGTVSLNSGTQTYAWNGVGNNGVTWADGNYTLSITATGASGSAVSVTTQTVGTVSSVNVSTSPPQVTVSGQSYPISSIQSISSSGITNILNQYL